MLNKDISNDVKVIRKHYFYNKELQQALEETIIFNCLFEAIENCKTEKSLFEILKDEDFKEDFDFMTIKSNKRLLLEMIDEKISKFQASMLETDKIYNKLKNIACYIDNRLQIK